MRLPCVLLLGAVLAACLPGLGAPCDVPRTQSSAVRAEGQRLTFDPKTCTAGTGMFYWGLGSVRVTLLGHRSGHCVFDYQWEVEGAGSYVVHRVRVPIGSGPVLIDAERRDGEQKHHWSVVFTSFTEKEATLIRRAGFGWLEDRVEGTGDFVAYRVSRPGDPPTPAVGAKKVTLRFTVYGGRDFKQPAERARQGQVVTLATGKGRDWRWARVASAGMAPGEVRQVRLPVRIAGDAKGWLPGAKDDATLFLEMERDPK